MKDSNKNDSNMQTISLDKDLILVIPTPKPNVPTSRKKFSHPVINFSSSKDESIFKEKNILTPDTLFSPKDKVSNRTWENELPIGEDMGIVTARRAGDYGCVVQLDYEKIINSDDVVTSAELSYFDRCVYDAVVTLHVAGNDIFSTTDLWHIISHNPKSRITPVMREKIIKSMFHISSFWMSIVTDHSEKMNTWDSLNKKKTFNPERKIYKRLQSSYTGRLLDFRVIGKITYDVSYSFEGQEFHEKVSYAEFWKILAPPILYQYAHDKGQVSAVPIKYLDTSKKTDKKTALNRGDHTDELASFLSREIDTMKKTIKRKQPYSRIILLERIYQIDGIEEIQQNENNIRIKKKTTRDKLVKILERLKENGIIAGHTFHKKIKGKAAYLHSVEIIF